MLATRAAPNGAVLVAYSRWRLMGENVDAGSHVADRYLDGSYLDANPTWHDEDAPIKAGWVVEILGAHPEISLGSICDVGCGTGGVLESLRDRLGKDVRLTGFEPSQDAVRIAREKRPELQIIERGARAEDGPFDVAVVLDVFEHVEDYLGFLRGLQGLADRYVFLVPLDMTGLNIALPRQFMELRETLGHLHHFSPQTARASLTDTGYQIVESRFMLVADDEAGLPAHRRIVRRVRRVGWRLAPDFTARMIGGLALLVLAQGGQRPPNALP
jgi:SAM-dependent methyltransferase